MDAARFLPPPRIVFWEATAGCNLECVHCRRIEVSKFLSRNDLSTEQAMAFIESLAGDFQPPPVLILSGGEPLMRPDILTLARFAVRKGVQVALSTNGTIIDIWRAREIAQSGIRRVSISLDGSSPEIHDKFRNIPGAFQRAVSGFLNLRSFDMPMQLNATLTRHNLHQLDKIYDLAIELGAESLYYFLLVPVGCGLEIKKEYQLSPADYEQALRRIYGLASDGRLHIRPVCAPHYFRILASEKSPLLKKTTPGNGNGSGEAEEPWRQITKGCLAGSGVCFVSHKGEVFPCGYLPLNCGNILERSLGDIWRDSPVFHTLRDPDALSGKCGACEYRRICYGCRARAFEENGDYLSEEPNCLYQPEAR